MAVEETSEYSINFYKKCLPVIIWNEKHLSKQFASITYTLEKMFFAVATFEGLRVVKKTCIIVGLYDSSLNFKR